MNNKQHAEVMGNATLIAKAVANVHALRFAVKQSAFEECRADLVKDLRLAEIALAALTTDPVGEVAMMDYSTAKDNGIVWVTLSVKDEKANSISLNDKLYARAAPPTPFVVKFTDCDLGAVRHMSGGSIDYCNGFVDGINHAKLRIRVAGGEVAE